MKKSKYFYLVFFTTVFSFSCSVNDDEKEYRHIETYLEDGYWVKDSTIRPSSKQEHRLLEIYNFKSSGDFDVHIYDYRLNNMRDFFYPNYAVTDTSLLMLQKGVSDINIYNYVLDTINCNKIKLRAKFDLSKHPFKKDSVIFMKRIKDYADYTDSLDYSDIDLSCKINYDELYGVWKIDSTVYFNSTISGASGRGKWMRFDNEKVIIYKKDKSGFVVDTMRYSVSKNQISIGSLQGSIVCLDSPHFVVKGNSSSNFYSMHLRKVESENFPYFDQ